MAWARDGYGTVEGWRCNNRPVARTIILYYSPQQIRLQVLSLYRWEFVLVRVVVEWAKYAGCVRVAIISAEFNRYYNAGGDGAGHQKRLKVRYNATAQRCGFKRCSQTAYLY